MKQRNGYVSNSSSSSFIVLYDDGDGLEYDSDGGRERVFVHDFIVMIRLSQGEEFDSDGTRVQAMGRKNSMDYMHRCMWTYEDYTDESLDGAFLKHGNAAVLRVRSGDEIVEKMLTLFNETGIATILDSHGDEIKGRVKVEC